MTILLSRFSRFVASAAVPAVWCGKRLSKKKSDLLRQESNGHGLGTHSAVLSPHPVSGVVGVATLESAGESTVTWHSQLHPDARAARTRHGDPPPWQHVAASNSPPRANVVNKQNVSSVAELQKQRDAPGSQFTPGRRVARGELDGEHGPARDQMRLAGEDPFWYEPLQREDGDSNSCNGEDHCRRGEGHKCASTSYGPATNVGHGYWFAKFADGNLHYVTTLRLWNRADNDRQYRLDGACVRFSMDGTKPSNSDPASRRLRLKTGQHQRLSNRNRGRYRQMDQRTDVHKSSRHVRVSSLRDLDLRRHERDFVHDYAYAYQCDRSGRLRHHGRTSRHYRRGHRCGGHPGCPRRGGRADVMWRRRAHRRSSSPRRILTTLSDGAEAHGEGYASQSHGQRVRAR